MEIVEDWVVERVEDDQELFSDQLIRLLMKILANLHLFGLHRGHQSPARSNPCWWDSEIFSFSVFKFLDCLAVINLSWKGWRTRWSLVNTDKKNLLEKICIDRLLSETREHINKLWTDCRYKSCHFWLGSISGTTVLLLWYIILVHCTALWGSAWGNFRKIIKPFSLPFEVNFH